MMRPSMLKLIVLLLGACAVSGCSMMSLSDSEPIQSKRTGQFEVSVTSGGEKVSNFHTPLVHRVTVSTRELDAFLAPDRKTILLPFKARKVRDLKGEVKGIRVVQIDSVKTNSLGLRDNDLLTAVGRVHLKQPQDMSLLFSDLQREKQATLTLEREGKPHKILYYLAAQSSS